LDAPYAAPDFTLQISRVTGNPSIAGVKMKKVTLRKDLTPGSWLEEEGKTEVCFDIAKGKTEIHFG